MSSSNSGRIAGYAQGFLAVASAEGNVEEVRSQLRDVAQAVSNNDELQSSLGNNLLPAATRIQIVDDILGGKANDTVRALVSMVVGAGRGSELTDIVSAFSQHAAAADGKRIATVRTAVPLSEDQKQRLAQALSGTAGGPVELENVIDPEVVGGAVTTIGDTVIDGSLRSRLNQMREAL